MPVKIGTGTFFPDLVLTSGKKLAGLVEVESGESVNNLEAMAQWVHFSRARVPFHLYVPVPGYDAARRLCDGQRRAAGGDLDVSRDARRVRSRADFPRIRAGVAVGLGRRRRARRSAPAEEPAPPSREATRNPPRRPSPQAGQSPGRQGREARKPRPKAAPRSPRRRR